MKSSAVASLVVCALLTIGPAIGATGPASGAPVFGSPATGAVLASYREARALLDRALAAHGGAERIRGISNVDLRYQGSRTMVNQSRAPLGPWDEEPASGRMVVDQRHGRLYVENFTSYPGIGRFGGAWALRGDEGFHWEPDANHHGSEWMAKYPEADADGPWAFVPRWLPPLLLLRAADVGTGLRAAERRTRDGRAQPGLTVVQRDGVPLTFYLDEESGLVAGFESLRDDGVLGDVVDGVEFHDYQDLAGVRFPTRRVDTVNGLPVRDLRYSVRIDVDLDPALFEAPPWVEAPAERPPSERLERIAEGAYLDTEMGGAMVVEFRDFLVVVECPGDFWMSRSTIDAIARALPGKPIRYVVPSHTHGDHGGGARAYYQIGATVLTTPGNLEFYRRLATIPQSIRPDPQSDAPKPALIETFVGRRVISDGEQTLELHDLGPNAHAEELTIAYLPRERIVWQADLVFVPATGGGLKPAMPITVEFARRLEALGLGDFDRLVEAHHSRTIGRAEFDEMLRRAGPAAIR